MSLLRLLGAAALLGCGAGCGLAVSARQQRAWRQVHAFADLVDYLLTAIRYQAWPCALLLQNAGRDQRFEILGLGACREFAALPVPPVLGTALMEEARQCFAEMGSAPRQRACQLLARLLVQCRQREEAARRTAAEAARLCPRLGLCAGLLVILLLV